MKRLVLASGSESRKQMLAAAGVPFEAITPGIDEDEVKASLAAKRASAETVASTLADMKALRVTAREPDALVLGCDQVLACDGRLFDKAQSVREAREVLVQLRGREHALFTSASLAHGAHIAWRVNDTSRLWMREFSDEFLETYLVDEAEHIVSAVGCYHVEGRGAQLFSRVEGDTFAIRGLPLIPLLDALRVHGVVPS